MGVIKLQKKSGRPLLTKQVIESEIENIIQLQFFGATKIKNKENKAKYKENEPMKVSDACKELGISAVAFYKHLDKYPGLKDMYATLRRQKREYIKNLAENNIEQAIKGELDITDKDLVNTSFKMLELTDKSYQPKIEIESKSININMNVNAETLLEELKNLFSKY